MKLYDRPYLLCCQCPFESKSNNMMDSGRNTYNIMKIKLAFQWAYNTLLAHSNNKRKSILGLLVGIRGQAMKMRSINNEDKLFKFQETSSKELEISDLLSKAFEDKMEHTTSDTSSHHEYDSFIPLTKHYSNRIRNGKLERSPSLSTSSISTNSSSSSLTSFTSSSSYGDIDSDIDSDILYYEATNFQQKHLFHANFSKSPKLHKRKSKKSKNESTDNNKAEKKIIDQFSEYQTNGNYFSIKYDEESINPYLNNTYNPYKNHKKRNMSSINQEDDDPLSKLVTPELKKRKTMTDKSETEDDDLKDKNKNKLVHSFSMPDLRKSTPCRFYKRGHCHRGDSCAFQHQVSDIKGLSSKDILIDYSLNDAKRLNEICWNFISKSGCHRGTKCRWLHPSLTENKL